MTTTARIRTRAGRCSRNRPRPPNTRVLRGMNVGLGIADHDRGVGRAAGTGDGFEKVARIGLAERKGFGAADRAEVRGETERLDQSYGECFGFVGAVWRKRSRPPCGVRWPRSRRDRAWTCRDGCRCNGQRKIAASFFELVGAEGPRAQKHRRALIMARPPIADMEADAVALAGSTPALARE